MFMFTYPVEQVKIPKKAPPSRTSMELIKISRKIDRIAQYFWKYSLSNLGLGLWFRVSPGNWSQFKKKIPLWLYVFVPPPELVTK